MTKKQLFELIGEAEEKDICDAGKELKRQSGWVKWATLAACFAIVVGVVLWQVVPQEKTPGDRPPMLEWEGNTYIVSGQLAAHETQLPEGWVLAGTAEVDGEAREVYSHPDQPLWVYVHERHYISGNNSAHWVYQRYVDENLRGKHFVRYNGQLYIRLIHGWMPPYEDVDSNLCDRIERTYGVSVSTLPEGFVSVGEPVFTGFDTLPAVELGTNEQVEAIYANPDVSEILLTPTGNGYLVMIPYTGPLA